MKQSKPILHARDHMPGGADPITFPSSGGSSLPVFANTAGNITIDDSPVEINSDVTTMHFSTTDAGTFDSSGGIARILAAGTYVFALQIAVENTDVTVGDTFVESQLGYGSSPYSSKGWSIEVPWMGFGLGNERIQGTYYEYPDGKAASHQTGLQRIHVISVDDDIFPALPLEVHGLIHCGDTSGIYVVRNFALWGFRLNDPLDSYHSD